MRALGGLRIRLVTCGCVVAGAGLAVLLTAGGGSAGAATQAATSMAAPPASAGPLTLQRLHTVDLSHFQTAPPTPQLHAPSSPRAIPNRLVPGRAKMASAQQSATTVAPPQASALSSFAGNVSGEGGFDGVTATINGAENSPEIGGVGDVTPPDQGLAVGQGSAGTVLAEFVNQTLNFYSSDGATLLGGIPGFQVFGLPPNTFLSDPRVYWDPSSGHWFLTMFDFANSGGTISNGECSNGAAPPNCLSTQYIAVSNTTDPLGVYTVFSIDTSDSSNTANGCPCFGDFDQVGADANGFYISTNEFPLNSGGPGFNGTVIYAMSKSGLINAAEHGGSLPAVQRYAVPLTSGSLPNPSVTSDPFAGYHLAPSTVTQGSSSPDTEYFVESNANLPNNATASGLEVFELLHTQLLATGGTPQLVMTTVNTENYSELPPNAVQKAGPTPFATSQGFSGPAMLQTDFNAVQEVTYANGLLYAELSTGFSNSSNAGAAWFVLKPKQGSSGSVTNAGNGYVEAPDSLLYPVIGVNAAGHGYMAFAVSGSDMYPSAAYIAFNGANGPTGSVHLAAAGSAPIDDFSCYSYPGYTTSGCRYGDYSMAQEYNGNVYMATEYAAPQPREYYANWGTRLFWAPDVASNP
jgi:hypothetical protein